MRKKYIKPALEMTLAQMDLMVLAESGRGSAGDDVYSRSRQGFDADYDSEISSTGANSKQKGGGWGSLW
jgi:hypothetical protein